MKRAATASRNSTPFSPREAESFNFQDIKYAKGDWMATITINRPKFYNAYSTLALREMIQALEDASWDDGVAVVVITGEGAAAFCTGGDVKDYESTYTKHPREYYKWMGLFAHCLDAVRNLGKPSIARLNGMTVGGGNELNMACDLAIAAAHVKIRQVGTRVGSVACGGATQWLPIMVGDRRAREMLLLCEEIDAPTALQWGLINQMVPSVTLHGKLLTAPQPEEVAQALRGTAGYGISLAELDKAVLAMAEKLTDKFPECLRYTRTQTNFWKDLSWHLTMPHARDWLALHFTSPEPHEGMRAFVEKRPPRYRELRDKARRGEGEFLHGAPTRTCPACQVGALPQDFHFCGHCGERLE